MRGTIYSKKGGHGSISFHYHHSRMFRDLLDKAHKANIPIVDAYIALMVEGSITAKLCDDNEFERVCEIVSDMCAKGLLPLSDIIECVDFFVKKYYGGEPIIKFLRPRPNLYEEMLNNYDESQRTDNRND